MITKECADRIVDASSITEVIEDFVQLKRRGSSFVACCPFHNEKTPSFYVTPSKGFYYCHGCKKGGNVITFLKEKGYTYPDALKYLADKYHIEIEEDDRQQDKARQDHDESLYAVTEYAAKYFAEQLSTKEGHDIAYQYFKSRKLEDGTIEKWGLGWCPKTGLCENAIAAGYKEEYLVESGLEVKLEDGKHYDRFKERVIFPLYSVTGRVIGFGGRTLKDFKALNLGKYVNSSESSIYVKRKTLYGLYQAKQSINKIGKCILVEGYLDVISMHQLGITNVVASSGTSLTEEQVSLIKRFANDVTLVYDGDSAGIHAALRGVGLLLEGGLNVKVVVLEDGQDPDDFAKSHTLEEATSWIENHEKDIIEFKTDILLGDAGGDPIKRADVIKEIISTIALIPDNFTRVEYGKQCAQRFGYDNELILKEISATHIKNKEQKARQEGFRSLSASETRTESIPGADVTIRKGSSDDFLVPYEKSIVDFVINYGSVPMTFSPDDIYYTNPVNTVSEFIDSVLAGNGIELRTPVYKYIYDSYYALARNGMSHEDILRKLTIDENTCKEIIKLAPLMTSAEAGNVANEIPMLLREVPKAIILYTIKIREKRVQELNDRMKENPQETMSILKEISTLNKERKCLSDRIEKKQNN